MHFEKKTHYLLIYIFPSPKKLKKDGSLLPSVTDVGCYALHQFARMPYWVVLNDFSRNVAGLYNHCIQ